LTYEAKFVELKGFQKYSQLFPSAHSLWEQISKGDSNKIPVRRREQDRSLLVDKGLQLEEATGNRNAERN